MIVHDGGLFPRRVARRYLDKLNNLKLKGYVRDTNAIVRKFGLFGFHCYFEDDMIESGQQSRK